MISAPAVILFLDVLAFAAVLISGWKITHLSNITTLATAIPVLFFAGFMLLVLAVAGLTCNDDTQPGRRAVVTVLRWVSGMVAAVAGIIGMGLIVLLIAAVLAR